MPTRPRTNSTQPTACTFTVEDEVDRPDEDRAGGRHDETDTEAHDYHHVPRERPPDDPRTALITQTRTAITATMNSQRTVKPTPKAKYAWLL